MSTSPEEDASALFGNDSAAPQTNKTTTSAPGEGKEKGAEKTISCVSCRRRKLKCDRVKPKCGTCGRLRHECEYPERRRNVGTKRRNMKELEARLAQVETQLVAETKQMAANNAVEMNTNANANANADPDWGAMNIDLDMNFADEGLQDLGFDIMNGNPEAGSSVPTGDFFSQEVISLGLQEPLPPESLMDDLYRIYFERFHPTLPMIHKSRFCSAMNMPANHKPPVALRYAMMTVAASLSDEYQNYAEIFYERARRYAEIMEMKGHGEAFVCIQSVQTWSIISNYEATNAYFSRAWMSTGRWLDAERDISGKRLLPLSRDWVELEERRRTFWVAYYGDRWSSCATGWPMMFDEQKIKTNLPCSNDAFDLGIEEKTCSLAEALTPEGASTISSFAGVVLSACLFGQNIEHMFKSGPDEGANDVANGEFWKRHRKMDNVLSSTFMFLPDHLRLPAGLRDPNIVFFHMNIHCSTICLHQGAVLTAEREDLSQSFIRQSEARSLMAAEEIANLMRLISHMEASKMSSWIGFCLYVASGVILHDARKDRPNPQSASNLEFMMSAMKAVGKKHVIARHFAAQLELEIETQGLDRMNMVNTIYKLHSVGSSVVDDADLCGFPRVFRRRAQKNDSSRSSIDISQTPLVSTITPPQNTQQSRVDAISQAAPVGFAVANFPPNTHRQPDSGSETIDSEFSWPVTEKTPSADSSASNTAYSYRNAKPSFPIGSNGNWTFNPDATRFAVDPSTLNVTNKDADNNLQENELLNDLLNGVPWDTSFQLARDSRHPSG
ncbi:fungal specific transcription factor domain-containing protein [Sclerotinia borealis F-4128]|uniref:Fungal specific transcription factor domain-containing protein n=1 Tax=Sclerotinia borealis (strain F-4128) TaxID=1432307 RepID=W9CDH0_SCLBF|nr:fungal specific transcription factor domain-containing protein [Sclerotinia borealis F-4128]